jgi:hypothetical protein
MHNNSARNAKKGTTQKAQASEQGSQRTPGDESNYQSEMV